MPIHKHDCDQCIYLGRVDTNNRSGDGYICPSEKYGPTILFRYGQEGEYSSYSIEELRDYRKIMKERPDWWFTLVFNLAIQKQLLDSKYL